MEELEHPFSPDPDPSPVLSIEAEHSMATEDALPEDRPSADAQHPIEPSSLSDWLIPEETGPAPGAETPDVQPVAPENEIPDDSLNLELSDMLVEDLPAPPLDNLDIQDLIELQEPDGSPIPGVDSVTADDAQQPLETVLPIEPADALADLPPLDPTAPASGWLEAIEDAPKVAPAKPARSTESSDVLSGPTDVDGSDVLQIVASPTPDSSNIFDAPPEGSARFEDPADATDDGGLLTRPAPSSGLFADLAEPPQPSSAYFTEDAPPDALPIIEEDAAADLLSGESNTDLDSLKDAELIPSALSEDVDYSGSGVNLMDPERGPDSGLTGPGSSIFGTLSPGSALNLKKKSPSPDPDEDITENLTPPQDAGPSSSIFQTDRAAEPTIDHELPFEVAEAESAQPGPEEHVDWSIPDDTTGGRQVSQKMVFDEDEAQEIAELDELLKSAAPPHAPRSETVCRSVRSATGRVASRTPG